MLRGLHLKVVCSACRANLAKHKTKVGQLREELDKEEMYVEYLEKLLSDIELHR
jgi:hypothetical protein